MTVVLINIIKLRLKLGSDLPEVISTDSVRLRQILNNVIENAIKFTLKGGVTLLVNYSPSSEKTDGVITFAIEDTGIGISREHEKVLFAPFTQADSTITRRYGGAGLGLALSRQLARKLGGDLVLSWTEPGKGSRFEVTINPHRADSAHYPPCPDPGRFGKDREGRAGEPPDLSGFRVLIAEDSQDIQRLLGHFIKTLCGAKVDFAQNGLEAVEMATVSHYDFVLMDIQMPVMDGFQAIRHLRKDGYAGPIIVLTARAMKEEREMGLKLGCTEYLAKPIDRSELFDLLEHCSHPSM